MQQAQLADAKERDSQWEHVAGTLEQRGKDKDSEIESLRAQLAGYGVQDDPRDRRIAELERYAREGEANREREQAEAAQREKYAHEAKVEGLKRQYIDNIRNVARSNNIEDRRLAAEFQARTQVAKATGQTAPTVEQVASSLADFDRWQAGQRVSAQVQTSQGAPVPVRSVGSVAQVPEDPVAYLKSQGLI